jgi:hypothetical protein
MEDQSNKVVEQVLADLKGLTIDEFPHLLKEYNSSFDKIDICKVNFSDLRKADGKIDEIIQKLTEIMNQIVKIDFKEFENLLKEKSKATIDIHSTPEEDDNYKYYGAIDKGKKTGFGFYQDITEDYLYLGNWEHDHHSGKGMLISKDNEKREFYDGIFSMKEKIYTFKGVSLIHKKNDLAIIIGETVNSGKIVKGDYIYYDAAEKSINIFRGELVNFVRNSENSISIQLNLEKSDCKISIGNFKSGVRIGNFQVYQHKDYSLLLNYDGNNKCSPIDSALQVVKYNQDNNKAYFVGIIDLTTREEKFEISQKRGIFVSEHNYAYNGEFYLKDGKSLKHGESCQYYAKYGEEESYLYEGKFIEDCFAEGDIKSGKDTIFKGELKNGQLFKGIYKYENNDVYDGSFQNNQRSGYGKYTFSNGSIYIGDWSEGRREGSGSYQKSDKEEPIKYIWKGNNRDLGNE